jgi:Glycosyl transferase family 2
MLSKWIDPRRAVPDITVYIPAYNVAQFLRATASLLRQTLAPTEILVIDDASKMIPDRRFELLPLNVLLLAYLPYRDFRLWLALHQKLADQRSAAGA